MDYSLLLGIHETKRVEENLENFNDPDGRGETSESEDCDSGERWSDPDSPFTLEVRNSVIPEIDIYAIDSEESKLTNFMTDWHFFLTVLSLLTDSYEIYFLAIIDVLTHYGVKKQAAKAAKTVKYGSNVDGISTCDPEQYAKRFIEFIEKAIE